VGAREPAAQVLRDQVRIFRRDQVRQPAVDEIDAVHADEARELRVGVEDDLAMHQHRFVNAFTELGEQLRAGTFAAGKARRALQELVDRDAERLHIELSAVLGDLDALRQALRAHRTLHGDRQLGDRPQIAPLKHEQHEEQRRHECEQHADQS
jgi:hypothetical protein